MPYPKSPKLRNELKREAEKQERKPKKSNCKHTTVSDALRGNNKR